MTLTPKQQQILDAVLFLQSKGENPTVREIGQLVGLNAPATVHKHLKALQEAGVIEKSGKSRGIRVVRGSGVPVVGKIAAGEPIENYEVETDDVDPLMPGSHQFPELNIDPGLFLRGAKPGDLVALEIQGDSMVEAGIFNGDHVIIRKQPQVEEGQIAAVTIDGAGTLKRWSTQKNSNRNSSRSKSGSTTKGKSKTQKSVSLLPENERFEPIVITEEDHSDVQIFGRYVGLIRLAR